MTDLLFNYGPPEEEERRKNKKGDILMDGLATGVVKSLQDPLCLGRVQVAIECVDDEDTLAWARVAVPMANRLAGHYWIPREGSRVIVGFEGGDMNVPYVLGCLWDLKSPPPQQSPIPEIFGWRSPNGNQIVFTEKPGTITLQTSPTSNLPMPAPASPTAAYQTLTLTQEGIQLLSKSKVEIKVATNSLTMDASGITMKVGDTTLSLTASGISLNGKRVTISGSGGVAVSGSTITLN